ncbi:Hypothetical protein R9X50_00037400 [Acrodontium crateriforme]|uniref:AAA+ ATPase domain-containing protein n=1 Tax=Acrodontium crateriforme TaxID=150365 RepID=A0AAQ3LX50_9PEZI|nr:Hypothetical protein R9X50_00037400 [Acrodontium crateriforme]
MASESSKSATDSTVPNPASKTATSEGTQTTLVLIDSLRVAQPPVRMDENLKDTTSDNVEIEAENPVIASSVEKEQPKEAQQLKAVKKEVKCKKTTHAKTKGTKKMNPRKSNKEDSSSESDSEDESESNSDSSSSSSSEDETPIKQNKKATKKSKKSKKPVKSKSPDPSSSENSDSDDDSTEEDQKKKKKKVKKSKSPKKSTKDKKKRKNKSKDVESDASDSSSDESEDSASDEPVKRRKTKSKRSKKASDLGNSDSSSENSDSSEDGNTKTRKSKEKKKRQRSNSVKSSKSKKKSSKSDSVNYKRVDQLWDSTLHNYRLRESAEDDETEFAEYAFLVRRCFNWENKYTETLIDIKSRVLRTALSVVMKGCKSVSLETEEPTIDPNILFLYLEELRTYYKKTLKAQIKKEKKRKAIKKLQLQRKLCKSLIKYIDTDYADTKRTLYPLLEAGNITFDLIWALFKPNEIAVTSCYGSWDDPRCFKIDYATKCCSMTRGEWYCVEGKYLEYDGKNFGYGDFEVDVEGFKGPRKISSLATYPLRYAKDPAGMRKKIIERGATFVAMEGMQYKLHKGMAFMKKKKQIARININGRVMIDPATFRRVNPNYPISFIKPHEAEELLSENDEDDGDCSCCEDSGAEQLANGGDLEGLENDNARDEDETKTKYKLIQVGENDYQCEAVEVDKNGDPIRSQKIDTLESDEKKRTYTEDELLLTSPVVLGFAFSEKLWLEFTLSGVLDITYNETAFESLVVPNNQKSIVRALVESHKFHAAKTIDDVVQGKGKGLVAVLHGPPGTGKTLTAEGISELLKVPLYMVSAGELGTDPARLEHELQKILDIAHSWGAVLLLDEADVFLERRESHDLHRNALVSIFLRILEYHQGILFLTTNRIETFDEAFASRIHLALRYGELTTKAKKSVWKMFLDLVRKSEGVEAAAFSDADLDVLSRHVLNGRQIKNVVRTAQALALNEKLNLNMSHVKRVLDVAETFDRDLKGGTGYIDAMRSYT